MTAVWARVRAGFHSALRSSVALALMIGITSAVSIAAAAGAQRTDTAYDRFRAAIHGFDVMVISCPGGQPWPEVNLDRVGALPEVRDSIRIYMFLGYPSAKDGRPLFFDHISTDIGIGGPVDPGDWHKFGAKLLAGRLPNPDAPNEVVVSYRKRQDPAVKVGATIYEHMIPTGANVNVDTLASKYQSQTGLTPADFAEPVPLKVVGIALSSGPGIQIRGDSQDITGTPAFYQKYGPTAFSCQGEFGWLKNGLAGADGFTKGVQVLQPQAVQLSANDEATFARRNTHVVAVVLWLFSGLVAVAGLMIFGQALARQTALESTENPILRALGMTQRQLFGSTMLRALVIGIGAATVAVFLAILASGFFPTGIAGLLEPNPGISVNAPVVGAGAVFVVLAVLLISAVPAWRTARVRGDVLGTSVSDEHRRPSTIAGAAARVGAPASVVTGVRLALEPGRGRTAVPVRSAIVGLVLAIVALVSSLTFAASFQHLLATPRLIGVTFDTGAGNPFVREMGPTVRPVLARDPGLVNLAGGNFAQSVVVQGPRGSKTVNAWGLEQIKGVQHPPVIAGRWPAGDGEIAMGSKTMREAGVDVGDTVIVSGGRTKVPLRVVGRVVFPDFGFGPGLGEGAGVTFTQLRAFFPDVDENLYLTDIAPGVNIRDVQARVNPVLGKFGASMDAGAGDNGESQSLESAKRTRQVPTALAGVLALMAVAMLVHTLVSSIRRRRRDLAILKTLGFTRGQVSAAVAWQASALVAVSLVIGIPAGIVVGRWAWNLFADQLGVFPEAVVPLRSVMLLVPAALILANLIALLPGLAAGRTRPSIVLRAE